MEKEIRISLNQQDFRQLVRGKQVNTDALDVFGGKVVVKLILTDIGFNTMTDEGADAALDAVFPEHQ